MNPKITHMVVVKVRAPIGRPCPVTPWGKPALGYKTRKKIRKSDRYIVREEKVNSLNE